MAHQRGTVLCSLFNLADRPAPYFSRLEKAGFAVERNRLARAYTEDELIAAINRTGAFATIAGGERYTEKVFAATPSLRIIARYGVGYDMVDVAAATRHGVTVAMAYGGGHEAVADGAVALMLAAAHRLIPKHKSIEAGLWGSSFHPGLWKKTLGLVGMGRIGGAVARRCRGGFDMRVLVFDPALSEKDAAAAGVVPADLDTVLAESDFVSLHAPIVEATRNLINADRLRRMKPTCVLVNTARGGLVDEAALAEALEEGRLWGAGLDVFQSEPPVGSPLLGLDRVVLSPHATSMDFTAEERTASLCIDHILAVAGGHRPDPACVLNPETLA